MTRPAHDEWNDAEDGERFRRLDHYLSQNPWVESVDLKPGGALDAAVVELRQASGTIPESVAQEVYDRGLAIRSAGGYMQLTVSAPERRGGDLDPSEEQWAGDRDGGQA